MYFTVATGFPSGLYPLETRLHEIKFAVENGANEIDVVIDRSLVLTGQWDKLYDEVVQMKKTCGDAHLKVILGVGELGTYENVIYIFLNLFYLRNISTLLICLISVGIFYRRKITYLDNK